MPRDEARGRERTANLAPLAQMNLQRFQYEVANEIGIDLNKITPQLAPTRASSDERTQGAAQGGR